MPLSLHPRRCAARSGLWLWLGALLLAQALGLAHRYAHVGGAVAWSPAWSTAAQSPAHSRAWPALPDHAEQACALLDHLCLGDAHTAPVPVVLAAAPAALAVPPWAAAAVGHAAPTPQARGPPVLLALG